MADPYNPTGSIPADQAMLLRVIDARFETSNTKVDGVAASLKTLVDSVQALTARYDKRFDDHEHRLSAIEGNEKARALLVQDYTNHKALFSAADDRIASLEKWQTEEQTTTRNASKWGSAIWAVFGSGVSAGAIFIASLFFQSQPPVTVNNNGSTSGQQVNGHQAPSQPHQPGRQHANP